MAEQNVKQSKGVDFPSGLPAALTTGASMSRKFRQHISKAYLSHLHVGGLEPEAHMTPLPEWLTSPDCPSGAGWDLNGALS